MVKTKSLLAFGLVALLGLVTVLGVFVGQGGPVAEMSAPKANMPLAADFKAQPASGAPADVAWSNLRVNNDSTNEAQNEPFVAVNPNDANHIVVGANSWQVGSGNFEVFAYVSFDGGMTWTSSQPYISRNGGRVNAADPTVAFGADGSVYFAFVALSPAPGAVAVSRSTDGGLTWSSQSWATSFNSAADKPAIAAGNGRLYLYYQNSALYGKVSGDNGATWSGAAMIESGGRNAYPVVDSQGAVNVFYNTNNSIRLARWSAASSPFPRYRITTVANAVPLQARPTAYRATVYPAAAAGSNGSLYVAWADGRNAGQGNDILYSYSFDSGNTWSAPVTLNTDGTGADQLMPAVSVDAKGNVAVAWLDNRNDPANVNYDVYMATSSGGVHFSSNFRVTSVSSNPYNDPRTQGTMIGDYFHVAAANGVAYVAWTDTRNNNEDIYLAPVTLVSVSDN